MKNKPNHFVDKYLERNIFFGIIPTLGSFLRAGRGNGGPLSAPESVCSWGGLGGGSSPVFLGGRGGGGEALSEFNLELGCGR